MKKVTSIICVLCLIVGMLTGIEFAPSVEAAAQEELNEIPGKITVIDFSSLTEFPGSGNYAEVKVASGSAISLSAGGNTKWTYGLIAIEPDDGWTFTGAKYKKDETDTVLEVKKLSDVIKSINDDSGDNVPKKINTLFEGFSEDELQNKAIYIDRATYTNIVWGDDIVLSYEKGEETGTVQLHLNKDFRSYFLEVNVGETFNFFNLDVVKENVLENGKYKSSDFRIEHYGINSTPASALEPLFESDNSENYGEFEVKQTGKNEIHLVNKLNGIQHEFSIDMLIAGEMPLVMTDFNLDEESSISSDTGDNDTGKYSVYPEGKNVFKDFSMNFELPDGVTVSNATLTANGASESDVVISSDEGSKTTIINYDGDPITVNYTEAEDKVQIDIGIQADNKIISGTLKVVLNKGGRDYEYSFMLWYRRPFSISGQGSQIYPVAYMRKIKLIDLISTSNPDDVQMLYDGITSGKYEVEMQGIKPVFENGIFNGNLIAYYPCTYMSLNDNTTSTVLYSGSARFQIMNTTAIEAGQVLDMSTLLNGYWNYGIDNISVDGPEGYEITNTNETI